METTRSLVIALLRRMDPWLTSHLSRRMLLRRFIVFLHGLVLRFSRHLARRRISTRRRSTSALAKVSPEKKADATEDSNTS
jgi:hypothetical protein